MKCKSVKAFVLSGVLLVSACGGGGSSDGSGGGSTMFAGTYSGTETITITLPGGAETDSGTITITINANGTVTVVDENGTSHQGTINNADFTATGGAEGITDPSVPGVTCNVSQTYEGTVDGDTITGTTSGNLACSQNGASFTAPFSGNFTATLNG